MLVGLHRIATNLGPIYELKNSDFLDSWAINKLVSLDRKLAFTSISGSDWYTSKQKVYNSPSNKSDLRPHHDRLASSRPSHAIRMSIGIKSGPRTTTAVIHLRPTSDWPVMLCDRLATDRDTLATVSEMAFILFRPQCVTAIFWISC